MVTFIFIVVVYLAWNLISTEPLDSMNTITGRVKELVLYRHCLTKTKDEYAHETEEVDPYREKEGIPPIADIPITVVNKLLFQNHAEESSSSSLKRDRSRDDKKFLRRDESKQD
jgi:hypothetical protein